jgi:hypothetical protein
MPQFKAKLLQSLLIVIIATLLVGVVIYAWTEPSQSPPGGNVPAPLNVGPDTQNKTGGLTIGGNVGIGTTYPSQKLDLGNSGRIVNVQDPMDNQDVATKAWVLANAGGGGGLTGGCWTTAYFSGGWFSFTATWGKGCTSYYGSGFYTCDSFVASGYSCGKVSDSQYGSPFQQNITYCLCIKQ